MATEDDALKTLQNIEKLLKNATALSANGNKPNFSGKSQQSQKERADREARKAFKAVASSANSLSGSMLGLSKTLSGLNTEVGSTTKSFGALNAQMAKFRSSLQPVVTPNQQSSQQLPGPGPAFNNSAVVKAIAMWGDKTVNSINAIANLLRTPPRRRGAGTKTPSVPSGPGSTPPATSILQRMMQNFAASIASAGALSYAFESLIDAAKMAATDFFTLSRVGMGSIQNLKDLYVYSVQAGMSLAEYNDMLSNSITVASKAGTLENYNKIISAQDDALLSMGLLGKEARQFQASLAQSSASSGISINDLAKSTEMQVKMFKELQKTTRLTSQEFASMVSSVAKSADAQRELIGLSPKQRLARMQELVQLQTVGAQFGMTAEASKRLGDAMMKMRQSTVKERIDQGAALLQLGAFTGNGAAGQRAYELNLKGRRRTAAEDKELMMLVQQLDRSSQGLYETGSLGMQNALDHFDEQMNRGSLGDLMRGGREAALAKDAGAQNQEAFGKSVNEFEKAVGKAVTLIDGLKQSIAAPIIAAIGAGMLAAFRGPLVRMLGGIAGGTGGVGGGSAVASGVSNLMSNMVSPLKSLQTGLGSVFASIKNWGTGIKTTYDIVQTASSSRALGALFAGAQGFSSVVKGVAGGFTSLLKGAFSFVKGFAPLTILLGGIFEAFTGKLATALDPNGGVWGRITGVVTSLFAAVPQMIIDGLTFVFGPEAMKPIQNVFDWITAGVTGAINVFARLAVGAVSFLTDFLPDDSALKKMVNRAKDSLDQSIAANAETIRTLGDSFGKDNKTLSEISKKNEETASKTKATTKTAATTAADAQDKFNNVVMSGQVSAASVIADARTFAAPSAQVQPTVQAPVNKEEAAESKSTQSTQSTASEKLADNPEILSVLQALLQVMRDNYDLERRQALNSDELLAKLGRPSTNFQSAEAVAGKLLQRGT